MVRYRRTQKSRNGSYLSDPNLSASAAGILALLDLDEHKVWNEEEIDELLPIKQPECEPYLQELVAQGYLVREE